MKTVFFLLAFFSSFCLVAQNADWQDKLITKMKNEGKNKTKGNTYDEDKNKTIEKINEDTIKFDRRITNYEDTVKIEEEENNQETLTLEPDSSYIIPEAWDTNFDNLLNSWYITHYANKLNQKGYQETVPTSDSVYMDRLSKLPNIIELPYNSIVRSCIESYVGRRRNAVEYMLGLESFYFPMIEETLNKYGLPLELKYLTIIESALNPMAFSRAGASGLWQFILPTGKNYGLEINSLIDERRDPIKSTDAACRYLKDLYDTYKDWSLAIAAYNCGGGNVNKAIRRAKGKTDYWAIYPYLPRETRTYLPLFIAANYAMNYYANHQLYPVQMPLPFSTDTVMVNQMIHFDQIADILKIDKDMIRALNPQYSKDIIPGNYQPQTLRLPTIQAYDFVEKEAEIANYKADELFTNRTYVVEAKSRIEKIIYTVKYGESVVSIANKYGLSASNIRKWNYIGSNKVHAGKKLILYVDNGGYPMDDISTKPSSVPTTELRKSGKTPPASKSATVRYKVKKGETFSTIAEKYPGYSVADLMRLNNKTSSVLKAGQYILVPNI